LHFWEKISRGGDAVLDEGRVPVASDTDLVLARQTGRRLAQELGFSSTDITLIATAISEVARNIIQYAGAGEIVLETINDDRRVGILVIARDKGPGIDDIALAIRDGYTTGKGMGLGLPGSRRLMDEFEIDSEPDRGTTIVMKKWLPNRG
jgi:serine/threonine-protein kinase RsbT